MTLQNLTPADEGVIAAALDDAHRLGLGDDSTVDQVFFALTFEADFTRSDAEAYAYLAVHGS